jgi:hypothetical protein
LLPFPPSRIHADARVRQAAAGVEGARTGGATRRKRIAKLWAHPSVAASMFRAHVTLTRWSGETR